MRATAQGSACQTIAEESASSAGAEKHVEPEFRFEERAEGLAGGATVRSQTRGVVVDHETAEVARRQSSPYTGKLSARPAGKPGDFFIVKGEFATIPSSPLLSAPAKNTGRPVCVFKACRNLSGPMWFQNQNQKPNPGVGPCRLPLVGPEPR